MVKNEILRQKVKFSNQIFFHSVSRNVIQTFCFIVKKEKDNFENKHFYVFVIKFMAIVIRPFCFIYSLVKPIC